MREEHEPTDPVQEELTEESDAQEITTLPVGLRNDEISERDFEELFRLAEAACTSVSPQL